MNKPYTRGIFFAVLAAALYAVNAPFSKILLTYVPPTLMAGLLYVGAGLGMAAVALIRRVLPTATAQSRFTKAELPAVLAMIALDIAAPICLMLGLTMTSAADASLLNNFEIVATAIIALSFFGERISPRLWLGIAFITLSCTLLSFEDILSFSFSRGALFVLLACLCWGLENNCTRKLSTKDPLTVVLLKGIFSGGISIALGLICGERITALWSIPAVLLVGLIAYGLSIFFYVYAQRTLGAARTSAYYAIAPFIGTALSLIIFRELPPYTYFIALAAMIAGTYLCSGDGPLFRHKKDT